MMSRERSHLIVGATGFVGRRLARVLSDAGVQLLLGSRRPLPPDLARLGAWRQLDVDVPETLDDALAGVSVAYFLVHGMSGGPGYETREARAARAFASAAARAGVSRIVYLGGPRPPSTTSRHLASRVRTGELLRSGPVPVVELRATMIVGPGSESFRIVRDLAVRLPVMVLPKWLDSRSQPVAIEDVVTALVEAGRRPDAIGTWGLPGPETMSAREMLWRVAAIRGTRPLGLTVPVLSPRLSAYWIELVTRAHGDVARELVEGLRTDLVFADDGFWSLLPEHARVPFDVAAARSLRAEAAALDLPTLVFEGVLQAVSRHAS